MRPRAVLGRRLVAMWSWLLVATLMVLSLPQRLFAHELGASKGEYAVTEAGTSIRINLSAREGALAAGGSGDAAPSAEQAAKLAALVVLRRGETVCEGSTPKSSLIEKDWLLELEYPPCGTEGNYHVELGALFKALRIGHTHAAFISDSAGKRDDTLHSGRPTLELAAPAGSAPSTEPAPVARTRGQIAVEYIKLGIEHILMGFDHLVFLLGLVIIGGRLKHMLAMVTAFTVAHSVTLGLAVTGVFNPPGSVIEPLIALSVAYVGVENFLVKDASKRWRITAAFGLIHGFGFAGALGEIGVPQGHLALGLATFNVGVELGQLMVMALVLPIILALGKREWFRERGVKVFSVAVAVLGLFWFVTRLLPEA